MKAGLLLPELAAKLREQKDRKRDFLVDTPCIRFRPAKDVPGIILEGVNGGMEVRPVAHQQLANAVRINKKDYDFMLENAPDLLSHVINYWMGSTDAKLPAFADFVPQERGSRKLVRTLDGQVRAVLSDQYRPLDNIDLFSAIMPELIRQDARVESSEITESRLYIKAVTPRLEGQVKVGQRIQGGLVASNSEVGQGGILEQELDFNLICANGMIRASVVRKRHVGRNRGGDDFADDVRELLSSETQRLDDQAFWAKVKDVTRALFDPKRFELRLNQYRESTERVITKEVPKVVELVGERYAFTEEEQSALLDALIKGNDYTQWGLANGVTAVSQKVKDYDRATELERVGGQLIELPKWDF
jgi:hypothetical protein